MIFLSCSFSSFEFILKVEKIIPLLDEGKVKGPYCDLNLQLFYFLQT